MWIPRLLTRIGARSLGVLLVVVGCSSGSGDGVVTHRDAGAPAGDAGEAERPPWTAPPMAIVVWEGLRPERITADGTPTLHKLREGGVVWTDHHAVFPTTTTMNAAALATGSSPAGHGLYGPVVYQPAARGLTAGGRTIDSRAPIGLEDRRSLEAVAAPMGGRLLLVDTFLQAAQAKGARTAVLGAAGATFLQDPGAGGILVDDDHAWPARIAKGLQMAGVSLPANSEIAYPEGDIKLAAMNGSPTAPIPITVGPDFFINPAVRSTLPFQFVDQYFAYQVAFGLLERIQERVDIWVLWLRASSQTARLFGPDAENHQISIEAQDRILSYFLDGLREKAGAFNVVVLSDHGISTVSAPLSLFPPAPVDAATGALLPNFRKVDPNGFTFSGGVRAADLLVRSDVVAYDGSVCVSQLYQAGHVDAKPVYPVVAVTEEQGAAVCGVFPASYQTRLDSIPDPVPSRSVIVAQNGGSELLYVPGKEPDVVRAIVRALQSRMEIGPIFVARRYGNIPGTLPMAAVRLEPEDGDGDPGRFPDLVVSYDWDDTVLHDVPGISFSSMLGQRGSAGSFSSFEVRSVLIANGPAFKKGAKIALPSSIVDVAPTLARVLGLSLPGADGRPLLEGLAEGGRPEADYTVAPGVLAPERPATGLTIHKPTSPLARPDPKHLDLSKSSYTMSVRTKTVTIDGHRYVYFDLAEAIRD
jgi:predicted AlkP superfamily pyrophosphatase or phosphodiesterase